MNPYDFTLGIVTQEYPHCHVRNFPWQVARSLETELLDEFLGAERSAWNHITVGACCKKNGFNNKQ